METLIVGASGVTDLLASPTRTDLSPIAKAIPSAPPADFPAFDPARPDETDFQLRQALAVAKALTIGKRISAN